MDDTSAPDPRDEIARLFSESPSPAPARDKLHPQDDHYFDTYAYSGIHRDMIRDKIRTDAYREAIVGNPSLFEGKTVLDIGCGTGILSLFAAEAGAEKVYAIDRSDIVHQARKIVEANGRSDVIEVIQGKAEEIELPCEVDIIISEWMGYFLLYEAMLDSVLVARDRFLKPGGILLPDIATISVRGIDDTCAQGYYLEFWDDVYGYDMTTMKTSALSEPLCEKVAPSLVVTEGDTIFDIDIATVTKEELAFAGAFDLEVTRDSKMNAFTCSFDVLFTHGEVPVVLSTGPNTTPTHWQQTTLYIKNGFDVKEGDIITGTLACRPSAANPRNLDIAVECGLEGSNEEMKTSHYRMV